MPWEVYSQTPGYRDLVLAMASYEIEVGPKAPECPLVKRR